MIRLHINIDHVATLRNQRDTVYPDPSLAATLCLDAGADGITVHLREDRRHIRDHDVTSVRALVPAGKCLNLEMAATAEMVEMVRRVRPDAVTLVPERREERTTEGGLNVEANAEMIGQVRRACQEVRAELSLFIEPNVAAVKAAARLGAGQVEFHTGHYCETLGNERAALLPGFYEAADVASQLGLRVAAGHGLTCENVAPIVAIPHLVELNIGHSVVADAVMVGLPMAVGNLRAAIDSALGALSAPRDDAGRGPRASKGSASRT